MKKLLILLAVVLCSCGGGGDKIRLVGEPEVEIVSLSKVRVRAVVENSSRRTVRITEGRFTLHTSAGDVATVLLRDEIIIPRRATTEVETVLRVQLENPLAALGALSGDMLVSGEAMVRAGAMRKKVKLVNKPVSEFEL